MEIDGATRVGWLLDVWPDSLEILEAWDLEPNGFAEHATLAQLCRDVGVALGDLLVDLEAEWADQGPYPDDD